jgi:hypothetical protein
MTRAGTIAVRMRPHLLSVVLLGILLPSTHVAADPTPVPANVYTADGKLVFPERYREWPYLSSGLDMSYNKRIASSGHSTFQNVFVNPQAYRAFMEHGAWPDGTVLFMEIRSASTKGSINQSGKFQSALVSSEAHVRDSKRFAGGWGFFEFEGTGPAALIPQAADCYACHREHGAVDTTFVQFYPTLLEVAAAKGTLSAHARTPSSAPERRRLP